MDMSINILAVILAAISTMVVGSLWYGKYGFYKQWTKLANVKVDPHFSGAKAAIVYGGVYIGSLVTAIVLAYFAELAFKALGGNFMGDTLIVGLLGWLGFVDHRAQRKRSAAELEKLGVRTAAMTRPVEMLSGGQRQVVALARGATRVTGERNGVLLLDEPTAALGYEQTMQVQALIGRLAEQGVACVLVTHNLPLAMTVCDRIVVLNRGRKVADVPVAETGNDQLVGWITGARPSMFDR